MDKKFRGWNGQKMMIPAAIDEFGVWYETGRGYEDGVGNKEGLMLFVGVKDKNGILIFENDILEFSDKWEWYRYSYGIKMRFADEVKRAELQKQYDAEPMERRVIKIPESYEWLLSSEIQTYWQVVGNVFQNPELISETR